MDLNIYTERKKPFEINKFKEDITLFLLRNQIKSAHSSAYLHDCTLTLHTLVKENLLDKSEEDLAEGQKNLFIHLDKFEKSELFENLPTNEKSIFSCLISFTKQYIKALQDNNDYIHDKLIKLETVLMKMDVQEMFNFSKNYFSLFIKNKKLSFDSLVQKEIKKFEEKYLFKDIYFRKSLDMRDKIMLLKNLDTLDKALTEIANDFDILPTTLSLNGLVTISFEPDILGYSSAGAYMTHLQEGFVISLGKYENMQNLKQSYFHEFAHCLDYSNYKKEKRITYSEQALPKLKEHEPTNVIERIIHNELGFTNYYKEYKDLYKNMLDDIFLVLKKQFKIKTEVDFYSINNVVEDMRYIVNNHFKLDTYSLAKSFVVQALINKGALTQALELKNNLDFVDVKQEKFKSMESNIQDIRNKYYYVLSSDESFFLHESKKEVLLTDLRNNKVYYSKVLEIFARAFETVYRDEKSMYYTYVEKEEKEKYKLLIKEAIEYMLPDNKNTLKRKVI